MNFLRKLFFIPLVATLFVCGEAQATFILPNTKVSTGTKSGTYTVASGDQFIPVTSGSAWTLTLPSAATLINQYVTILNIDSAYTGFAITISGAITGSNGSESDWKIHTPGEKYVIYSNGTTYFLLEHITKTQLYSPGTITVTAVTTNPTKGSITLDAAQWERDGSDAIVHYNYDQAAGSNGSGDYLFSLPNSLTIDSTKLAAFASASTHIRERAAQKAIMSGVGHIGLNSTQASITLSFLNYDGATFRVWAYNDSGPTEGFFGSGQFGFGSALGFRFHVRVPITGWKP